MAQAEAFQLEPANPSHLDALVPLVRGYHEFEHVCMSDAERAAVLAPLLEPNSPATIPRRAGSTNSGASARASSSR
jgi:hypothetical protein